MKEFFSIGEVSKLFDINKKTLRYYDEIDLFKPSFVNKENKYRYYTLDQFQYLETIKYLKELGLSLEKIKHLNIYPLFLKERIMNLPQVPEHLVEIKE